MTAPLKVLWLSNSNDNAARGEIATSARRPELMAARLQEAIGRPVELVVKPIRPDGRLPDLVERWLDAEDPEVVWLNVAAYWFTYESVPRRVERLLGRTGKALAEAGDRAARDPRFANSRAYRTLRRLVQAVVGGDTPMTPQEVFANVERTARLIARREQVTLIIEGPRGRNNFFATQRAARRGERRRLWMHRRLDGLARQLRCRYHGSDRPLHEERGEPSMGKDAFHMDAAGHAWSAEMDFSALLGAVSEASKSSPSDSIRAKL